MSGKRADESYRAQGLTAFSSAYNEDPRFHHERHFGYLREQQSSLLRSVWPDARPPVSRSHNYPQLIHHDYLADHALPRITNCPEGDLPTIVAPQAPARTLSLEEDIHIRDKVGALKVYSEEDEDKHQGMSNIRAVATQKPLIIADRSAAPEAACIARTCPDPGVGVKDRFKCHMSGCTKSFERRYNLKVHVRKHTGEKPYKCNVPGCGMAYKWRSSMAHHMQTHEKKPFRMRLTAGRVSKKVEKKTSGKQANKQNKDGRSLSGIAHSEQTVGSDASTESVNDEITKVDGASCPVPTDQETGLPTSPISILTSHNADEMKKVPADHFKPQFQDEAEDTAHCDPAYTGREIENPEFSGQYVPCYAGRMNFYGPPPMDANIGNQDMPSIPGTFVVAGGIGRFNSYPAHAEEAQEELHWEHPDADMNEFDPHGLHYSHAYNKG